MLDKEHEIDPFLAGAIKDADSEKKIKELYEKAYGLDIVKPRLQQERQSHAEVRKQFEGLQGEINSLRTDYQRGDFDSFFAKLQIPEEKLLQWMYDKITYNQLPPEQRAPLDARKASDQRAWQAEQRAAQMETVASQHAVEAKRYALQVALEKPDVKSFVESFNSRAGKPDAFMEALYEMGESAWNRSGGQVDLTPEQAIQEVMKRYQAFLGDPAPQAQAPQNPSAAAAVSQAQGGQVPVIPNVGGRTTSPTKAARPKSIDDLKKLAAAMT